MLRSSFFLLLLAVSCGSFSTGPSSSSGSGSSGSGPTDGGPTSDGGRDGGGGTSAACPPSAALGAFCDNFDRDGDQLVPPWDFASPKGVSLFKEGPSASPPGSLFIDVGVDGPADQPTHVLKSFAGRRRRVRIETKVNFIEDGEGRISMLTIAFDSVGGGVLPYRLELLRQFKAQPWRLEEFRQPGGRNIELKDAADATFKFPTGLWTLIEAEADLDATVFTVRIDGQQWVLEGLTPPVGAVTRADVKIGLPQAINVSAPYRVRFDDVVITPSR